MPFQMMESLVISAFTMFLELTTAAAEECLLHPDLATFSWVSSVRVADEMNIACIGIIVCTSSVIIPGVCTSRKKFAGYFSGRELVAVAGGINHTCSQLRKGRDLKSFGFEPGDADSSDAHSMMQGVALLEVEQFNYQNYPPSCIMGFIHEALPESEDRAATEIDRYTKDDAGHCTIAIYKGTSKKNEPRLYSVNLITFQACELSYCGNNSATARNCPLYQWSPETLFCVEIKVANATCQEHNVGSPLICENKILGTLKICDERPPTTIAVVQRMTVEFLQVVKYLEHGERSRGPPNFQGAAAVAFIELASAYYVHLNKY